MKAPLTYYGGKTRMLPYLLPLIPAHKVYVEAFVGGGSLFWAKAPSIHEVLNDLNGNIAAFYSCIKNNFKELEARVSSVIHCEYTHAEAKRIYFSDQAAEIDRAWSVWVLAGMSFGSSLGESFQWVRNARDNWHLAVKVRNKRNQFYSYAGRLDTVTVRNTDAVKLITDYDSLDTFYYLDPPYVDARQGHYEGYTQSDFDKLIEVLQNVKGKFLLSSYANKELTDAVERMGWTQQTVSARLGVCAKAQKKIEVLTWNYQEPQLKLF